MASQQRAVVLVSGGLDSATTLAIARQAGYNCYALSFDYGQRHRYELQAARAVVSQLGAVAHQFIRVDMSAIGGSALTDQRIEVPTAPSTGIPVTYVPARNTVFLSLALGWAEVLAAPTIFIGVNALDYSGYPDCRPEYIHAFERMANLATKAGTEGLRMRVLAPLIHLRKAEIIQRGRDLGVDYGLTVSCYNLDVTGRACGLCDACGLRREGFRVARIDDPTRYVPKA
ncbi:MAG: 7-cyano-7-deazaguanine synthase QueC [Gammaproteobacteria bacterium]|nr:7-cyano-7-deazaguanine synthase QueC [Gammaproteobacteria bacterium]